MTARAAVQVWLQGGAADGAVLVAQRGPDGRPPPLLMLCGGVVYADVSEDPEPAGYAIYELLAEWSNVALWPYRYAGTLTEQATAGPIKGPGSVRSYQGPSASLS